ncbi:MAG: 4-hydroxybenzoate octaprenyltransferase [Lysobacteraceae bacterium]
MGHRPLSRPSAQPRQPSSQTRFSAWWRLVRGDKPIGTLLLLWPTWWALWLAAGGWPSWKLLAIFTLGVWLTRSAGCVINDYADRWLDASVERTKARPLVTGEVSPTQALIVFAVLMLVAFGLVLLTNRLTVLLSIVGVFLAASYPYLKRYTWFPQVYLGLAFGWGIPMAFAAVQGMVPPLAWLLLCANVLWATGYDTWYAMVDREDDIRMGAKSTAILFGDADLAMQGILFSGFLAAMAFAGARAELGWPYWVSLAVAMVLVGWQFFIARKRERGPCFAAFLHNNWVGAVLFVGIAVALAMR